MKNSGLVITAVCIALVTINAQNTTCSPFVPSDSSCGIFSPMQTVLYPNQATELAGPYIALLTPLCPELKDPVVRATFPLLFCLGSMGTCYQAKFKLPKVKENGTPENLKDVALFYNDADLSELLPSFEKAAVLPPCYASCDGMHIHTNDSTIATMKAVKNCDALKGLGLGGSNDNCKSFPIYNGNSAKPNCVLNPGPAASALNSPDPSATVSSDNSAANSKESVKSNGSGRGGLQSALALVLVVASFA